MHADLSIKRLLARLETLEAEVAVLRRENQQLRRENQRFRRNDHSVTKAAEQTGMQRTQFQTLLKKHGLRLRDLVDRQD
jgi:predicted HTH domain antitoxin